MFWEKILFALLAIALIWIGIRWVKANPASFTKKHLNQSLFSLGILALILIAFIAALVYLAGGPVR